MYFPVRICYVFLMLKHGCAQCLVGEVHMCDMTRSHVWQICDSFTYVTWLVHMGDVNHSYDTNSGHHTLSAMGWLRLVGSLNHTSLLQKSPIKETIFKSTNNLKEPTNYSHPMAMFFPVQICHVFLISQSRGENALLHTRVIPLRFDMKISFFPFGLSTLTTVELIWFTTLPREFFLMSRNRSAREFTGRPVAAHKSIFF